MTPETNPHTPLLFGPKTKGGHDIDFIAGNGTHLTCIYPRCVIVGGIGYKLSAGGECFELDMWGDAFYDEETAQFDLVPCTMNDELAPQLYTMWEKDAEIARLRNKAKTKKIKQDSYKFDESRPEFDFMVHKHNLTVGDIVFDNLSYGNGEKVTSIADGLITTISSFGNVNTWRYIDGYSVDSAFFYFLADFQKAP